MLFESKHVWKASFKPEVPKQHATCCFLYFNSGPFFVFERNSVHARVH